MSGITGKPRQSTGSRCPVSRGSLPVAGARSRGQVERAAHGRLRGPQLEGRGPRRRAGGSSDREEPGLELVRILEAPHRRSLLARSPEDLSS